MPGGVLMLGHAEWFPELTHWSTEYYQGTFFYRRPRDPRREALNEKPTATSHPPLAHHRQERRRGVHPPQKTSTVAKKPKKTATSPAARLAAAARSPGDLLDLAREAINGQDEPTARAALDQLLVLDKTCLEAHLLLAALRNLQGDWDEERNALKRVLFLDKTCVVAHYLLGISEERRHAYPAALRRYQMVVRLVEQLDAAAEVPHSGELTAKQMKELSAARVAELCKKAQGEEAGSSFDDAPQEGSR
jgi:hypothetical protein